MNSQLVLQLLTPLIVASASLLVFFLARWPTRDHWAGSLLVDLSDVRSRRAARIQGGVIGISGSLGLAFSALSYYSGQQAHLPAYQLVLPLSLGLGAAYTFVLQGRVEMRDRGIFVGGGFLPWSRVESYAWEQAKDGGVALEWRVWPLLRFLHRTPRTGKIILPMDRRGEVEVILSKLFAEWPGRTIA